MMRKKVLIIGSIGMLSVFLLVGGWFGYLYASSPAHIRKPVFEHYHFRTQLIVNGKPVDFSADKFQQAYDKTSCSAELGAHPIDFHDNVDQMTHVHWGGMTGGEFLKYFGWNLIGGNDTSLGRRYDQGLLSMHTVKTFGNMLPSIPKDTNFYVYIGDQNDYKQKNWDDFLKQDLETFFGKKSNIEPSNEGSAFLNWLFPKASAHGGVVEGHTEEGDLSETELTEINNLIGNVVIFAQQEEPSKEQIQARFDKLVPLQSSTCGG